MTKHNQTFKVIRKRKQKQKLCTAHHQGEFIKHFPLIFTRRKNKNFSGTSLIIASSPRISGCCWKFTKMLLSGVKLHRHTSKTQHTADDPHQRKIYLRLIILDNVPSGFMTFYIQSKRKESAFVLCGFFFFRTKKNRLEQAGTGKGRQAGGQRGCCK